MQDQSGSFIFDSFDFNAAQNEAVFRYILESKVAADEPITFEEKIRFESPAPLTDSPALRSVLFDLHIALGMSYWKTYCPPTLIVRSGALSENDLWFWTRIYTKGLGEFFFENSIDFRNLIHFVATEQNIPLAPVTSQPQNGATPTHTTLENNHHISVNGVTPKAMVALGGGKDSLTTVGLLQQAHIPFDTVSLGDYHLVLQQAQHIGARHFVAHRAIDSKLFELNAKGALNGHVPISVIYALTTFVFAVGAGYNFVVMSNEQSANEGNVEYLGEMMNHQWSKSIEFESMLRNHMQERGITVEYFSVLRPLTEFKITNIFSHFFSQWAGQFTSCNRNFIQKSTKITGPRVCARP